MAQTRTRARALRREAERVLRSNSGQSMPLLLISETLDDAKQAAKAAIERGMQPTSFAILLGGNLDEKHVQVEPVHNSISIMQKPPEES
jgi:hypothetical protein